ncbi:MAG: hypothetical protein HKO66_06735, partial [Saprospiraceae bacterium]|nr:hypothetical protein [Bacteroidia bacterium]NNL91909.1 hypothetical protein [Saprospiraceae bacterium]
MKLIFTLLLAILFSIQLDAQSDGFFNYKNALKISPVEFGSAEFQISYEKYFGERNSSFSFTPSLILKENFEETKSGYQLMGQYRIFLSHLRSDEGKAILGFYNIGIYGGLYGLYFDYEEDYRYSWYN